MNPAYLTLRALSKLSASQLASSSISTTWSPNTPATVNEALIVSAPKINANFNTIGDGFSQEHNSLGSTSDVGQHIQSTYITQSTTPAADPANVRLFSSLVSAIPQIFAQYPTTVTPNPIQLTTISMPHTYSVGLASVVEFSFILNSQTLKIGTITCASAFNAQITFNTPFATVISLFGCMPATTAAPQNYNVTNLSITGFNINNAASGSYLYIAIGQ